MSTSLFDTQVTFYHPDLLKKKILGIEVDPVSYTSNGDGTGYFERTDNPEEDSAWSVHVRVDMEGSDHNPVDCIADFPTQGDADDFADLLRKLLKL